MSIALSSQTGPGYTLTNTTLLGTLSYNSPYTIMAWVYTSDCTKHQSIFSINDNTDNLVGFGGTSGTQNRDFIALYTRASTISMDVQLVVSTAGANVGSPVTTSLPIKANTWHHITLVRSSTSAIYVYVDGVAVTSSGASVSTRTVTAKRFDVGRDPSYGYGIVGRIAHVKVWTRALTAGEVGREKGFIAPASSTSMFAWYPTKPAAGAARGNDFSGNGRNLTISLVGTTPTPTDDVNPPNIVTYLAPLPSLTAGLGFSGKTTKASRKVLSGLLGFDGSAVRNFALNLSGVLGFQGIAIRISQVLTGGSLGFGRGLRRSAIKQVDGAISFGGSIGRAAVVRLLAALTFGRQLLNRRAATIAAGGFLSFVGNSGKSLTKRLIGGLSFVGNAARNLGRILSLIGQLGFSGGLRKYPKLNLIGAVGFVGEVRRTTIKRFVGSLTPEGVVRFGRFLLTGGELTFGGRIAKSVKLNLRGALSFVGAIQTLRQRLIVLVGALGFVGAFSRQPIKVLNGVLSFSGGIGRKLKKLLAGDLSFSRSFQIVRSGYLAISAALTFNGRLNKSFVRKVAGALSFQGRLNRGFFNKIAGALDFQGELGRGIVKPLIGFLSFAGDIGRGFLVAIGGRLTFRGDFAYLIGRNVITNVIHLLGNWSTLTMLVGYWKTKHDLRGEVDE